MSVRPARGADAPEIARVQLVTWRAAYDSIFPSDVLDRLTAEEAAAHWAAAVASPPSRRHRVLVAQEQAWIVGFAAIAPSDDPDVDPATTGEISTLLVEPRWGRRGHGSRLLAASVAALREDGCSTGVTWLLQQDRVSEGFYRSAGWERDGTARTLDAGGRLVDEVRLHTSLLDPTPEPLENAG